jgi:rfaE bifunctional protein nucleotidyltransferase chain/domain
MNEPLRPDAETLAKITDWPRLLVERELWRRQALIVVWTNGCFDILHVGHVRSLQAARKLGDVLVVGLNSDNSVRRQKGAGRPILPAEERAELLAALACVDRIAVFDESTPEAALARLQPDIHCKGADYAPPRGKPIPEAEVVKSYGGQVRFLPLLEATSTSAVVERIRALNDAANPEGADRAHQFPR